MRLEFACHNAVCRKRTDDAEACIKQSPKQRLMQKCIQHKGFLEILLRSNELNSPVGQAV